MVYFVIGFVVIIIIAIIALLVHHYLKHGRVYDPEDFKSAVSGLFGSHEGIIVLLIILATGLIL